MHGLVQCDKVFVATSGDKGVGAFAACAISEGEIVERGIVSTTSHLRRQRQPLRVHLERGSHGMGHRLGVLHLLQLL